MGLIAVKCFAIFRCSYIFFLPFFFYGCRLVNLLMPSITLKFLSVSVLLGQGWKQALLCVLHFVLNSSKLLDTPYFLHFQNLCFIVLDSLQKERKKESHMKKKERFRKNNYMDFSHQASMATF